MRTRDLALAGSLLGGSLLGGLAAAPATAQLRPLLDPPASAEAARAGVEVYVLNESQTAQPAQGPAEIETIAQDGTRLRLVAAPDAAATVAPGGFARLQYRLATSYPVATAPRDPDHAPTALAAATPSRTVPATGESVIATSRGGSGAFVDRLRPYAPTYAVMGAGNSGTKISASFDFRLLGRDDGPHLDFAYTHTFFLATDRPSAPLTAQGFAPEVFLDLPIDPSLTIGGGYRHDSNGGGVTNSVDVNRFYLRANKVIPLGHRWTVGIAPMVWGYFGDQGLAPDLDRYWGYGALAVSIGQRDGIKIAVTGRRNPVTGKGSTESFVSYPLARISQKLPHIYLFGDFFAGYGETLIAYDRIVNHARFGIAVTR
ncbi:phospholipase A [Sphingomonas sp. TREG-RG-20F-R18-01]|uniref:phospholipase A n=1 Tax=Sphingomonas sp. TREG-RG-20F-R18-01 TaxID=2914982 RepID=UPI001F589AAC|nr:phospholipase A [Sphingomonas sp. TREG-RG-20F-R18-01]